jgi:hypothetical protein
LAAQLLDRVGQRLAEDLLGGAVHHGRGGGKNVDDRLAAEEYGLTRAAAVSVVTG